MKNESYIKFRNLTTGAGEPIETILQRAIGYLQGLNEKAAVELRVSGDTGKSANSTHSIVLTPCGAHLQTGIVTKPARVAIITSEAFYSVAEGSYSPVQAYLDGKLRLLGNVALAKRIAVKLTESGTTVDVCPTLYNESWKNVGPGYGSLTLSGEYFTPDGTVEVIYNYFSGQYQAIFRADSTGS